MSAVPPIQTVSTGFVVAVVGFFSSFPIVLQGVAAMGATPGQTASALMAAAVAMGVSAILLALVFRAPISVAWSTPGVAFLAAAGATQGGFPEAVGAFVVAGGLAIVSGLWRPLERFVSSIPAALAQAMLAGVLVRLCIVPFAALGEAPWVAAPIVAVWFLAGRINRLIAVPAAVLAALCVTLVANDFTLELGGGVLTRPEWVMPVFDMAAAVGIGLPLYVVTMATQNSPGIAVLRAHGYRPPARPLLVTVGGFSVLSAPFGAPATCIAAITAAMCAGEDSHPDPAQRYWSAVMAGVFYTVFGIFAVTITAVAAQAPALTLGTLAGVALLGVFANSAAAALAEPGQREGAAITFLFTASGVSLFGLGAAVWGLLAGGIVLYLAGQWRVAGEGDEGA